MTADRPVLETWVDATDPTTPGESADPAAPPELADPSDRADPGDLADRVRSAVLAVDGVADLSGGIAGEVATYLPGRRVPGVRLTDDGAEVHLVVEHDVDIPAVGSAVQRAVRGIGPRRVDVHVDDVRVHVQHDDAPASPEATPASPEATPSIPTPVSD